MNLRLKNSEDARVSETPWYQQPETIQESTVEVEQDVSGVFQKHSEEIQVAESDTIQIALSKRAVTAIVLTVTAYGVLLAELPRILSDTEKIPDSLFYIVPALLALSLGVVGRSRILGFFSGAAAGGITVISAGLSCFTSGAASLEVGLRAFEIFGLMIIMGASLGIFGAQARRVWSQSRRIISPL